MRARLIAIGKHRLTHFVAVGAVLSLLAPPARDTRDISIDRARATEELRAQPNDDAKRDALRALVEQEVLAREAERLGLAQGDAQVRARLAELMRAHLEAATPTREPSDAEVSEYISTHLASLSTPRVSLRLLFFRGADARARAERALATLSGRADAREADLGALSRAVASDPSSVPAERAWTNDELTRAAGDALAKHVAASTSDAWQGPVASAWGMFLVRVVAKDAGDDADIRKRARDALREARHRQNVARLVSRLAGSYRVTVDVPPGAPTYTPRPSSSRAAGEGVD